MAAKAPQPQWADQQLYHDPQQLDQQQQAQYDPAAYAQPAPVEGKREKRRREMVDRVSRLHDDTVARRDRVFHDLSEIFARTADELLPPPVFPTSDLSIPVGQLPPSLPFTDPVIPDMHPIPYLFSLHRLSMERSNQQVAIRLFHQHQVASAKRLYEAEVERIEDEYEAATKAVVERLLEGVEERRRRLAEEKEGEGVTIDTFLEAQRQHGTRRKGGKGAAGGAGGGSRVSAHPSGSGSNGAASPSESVNGGANGKDGVTSANGVDAATLGSLLGLNGLSDPFNLAASLLPPSATSLSGAGNALSALSGVGPTASLLTGTIGKRKPGGRTQPGLPPAHFLVQSGTYSQFGKSLAGLSALRGEEIEGDLGEMRRKRQRTATTMRRRVLE
ncbi:hypothetical protein JCM10213_006982 [Rhodosporidiobolus nylandii]